MPEAVVVHDFGLPEVRSGGAPEALLFQPRLASPVSRQRSGLSLCTLRAKSDSRGGAVQ